jgi:hypothetical protein
MNRFSVLLEKYIYLILVFVNVIIYIIVPRIGIYDWDKEILYTLYIRKVFFT